MTGREYPEFSDGVWDDGEWLSWDWINEQIYRQELAQKYPEADPEVIEVFERLVEVALDYKMVTGKYLQIWGELGELYAEVKFGLKRHRAHTQGSDGTLGNDFVEVKTISPEKTAPKVHVKRAGNFSKLLVVRISEDFSFDAKMIDRRDLGKGKGKLARVSWAKGGDAGADV
ncbi:MAG TPA: hypothetical protein VFE82_03535 [Ramlibacter sp.]|jgi:hypothetical protein|uniref:hypothetical protein n=1 Tax=Ramlibacter sp. TaxID=1917967 RepID=UPI002D265AF9|nr:hypothetical protein [Ramlibacter sp.]HZY17524.1 hypothetical protein [Ramlibacter sp.]